MTPRLLSCPSCECPIKATESACPHCGSLVRREDNRVARSATAVALGLSAVLTAAGCEEPMDSPVYGVAITGTGGEAGTGGTGGAGGAGGKGGMGGAGGAQGGMGGAGGAQGGMGGTAGMGGKGGSGGM